MELDRIVLPEDFVNRMQVMLGAEFDQFIKAYDESNYHGLRLNLLKNNGEKITEKFSLRPVPWCETGFYYMEEERPGRHPYHHAGAYYIQEPSAMLVGELADARPGMKVLDLCAAPGGKTSHLAGDMQNKGVLVANEIIPGRARILSQNVERMGIRNCLVTNESPDRLVPYFSAFFDIIVVDTPCSGEGMFRRDKIARDEWSLENVALCVQRGRDILDAADRMLKPGGKLVYSTCTFAPDEDEMAISYFVKNHPIYHIEKTNIVKTEGASDMDGWPSCGRNEWSDGYSNIDKGAEKSSLLPNMEDTFRLWPHRLHGEGHYAAVLRKGDIMAEGGVSSYEYEVSSLIQKNKKLKDTKNKKAGINQALNKATDLYKQFAKDVLANLEGDYQLFADNLYLYPTDAPGMGHLKVERAGLHLGEIKKDRFEPSHALAMTLNPDDYRNVVQIDEKEAVRYLCGETINCDIKLKGWQLICVDGYSLGWGKAAGGVIKNHYPKGIRIKR